MESCNAMKKEETTVRLKIVSVFSFLKSEHALAKRQNFQLIRTTYAFWMKNNVSIGEGKGNELRLCLFVTCERENLMKAGNIGGRFGRDRSLEKKKMSQVGFILQHAVIITDFKNICR